MLKKITSFHLDDENHWVADLECGHTQHVRHDPPWQNRYWTQTAEGRTRMLGEYLNCKHCDSNDN